MIMGESAVEEEEEGGRVSLPVLLMSPHTSFHASGISASRLLARLISWSMLQKRRDQWLDHLILWWLTSPPHKRDTPSCSVPVCSAEDRDLRGQSLSGCRSRIFSEGCAFNEKCRFKIFYLWSVFREHSRSRSRFHILTSAYLPNKTGELSTRCCWSTSSQAVTACQSHPVTPWVCSVCSRIEEEYN